MTLWVPKATRAQIEDRLQFEQELRDRMVRQHLERVKGILDQFNYELKRIDPKLEMVRAGEDTHGTPLKPGYYHVVRWNDSAPPSVITIEGEHGEFVEPTSRVFERLALGDLWDPNNMRLLRQRERLAQQAAEKQKIADREERQAELVERWNAGTRTQISMNRETPWAQNHAGYKRTKGIKKEG